MARVYEAANVSTIAATKTRTPSPPASVDWTGPGEDDSPQEPLDSDAPSSAEDDDDEIGDRLQDSLYDAMENGRVALKAYADFWKAHRTSDGTGSEIEKHEKHRRLARRMLRRFNNIYAQKGVTNKDVRSNVNIISSEKFEWHQEVGPLRYYAIFGPHGLSRAFMERFRALASMRSHTEEADLGPGQVEKGLTFGQAFKLLLEARTQRLSAEVGTRGTDKHAEWQCQDCNKAAEMARVRFGMVSAKRGRKRKKTPETAEGDAGQDDTAAPSRPAEDDGRARSEERCDSVNGQEGSGRRSKKQRLDDEHVNGTTPDGLEAPDEDAGVATPEIGRLRRSPLADKSDADLGCGIEDDAEGVFLGDDGVDNSMAEEDALPSRFRLQSLFGPGSAGMPAAPASDLDCEPSSRPPTQQHHLGLDHNPLDHSPPPSPSPPPPPAARFPDAGAGADADTDDMPPTLKRSALDALPSARPGSRPRLGGVVTRFQRERLESNAQDGPQCVQVAQHFLEAFASAYRYPVYDSHSSSRRGDGGETTARDNPDTNQAQTPFVTVHSTSTTPFYLVVLRMSLADSPSPADAEPSRWLVSCVQFGGPGEKAQVTALCSTGSLSQETRARLRTALLTALPPERASEVNAIPLESYAVEALPTSADIEDHDLTDLVKSVAVTACMIANTRTEPHISIWAWIGAMSVVHSPPTRRNISDFETWVELPTVLAGPLKARSPAEAACGALGTIAAGLAMLTCETADLDKEIQVLQGYVEELQRIRSSIELIEREARAAPDPAILENLDSKIRNLDTTIEGLPNDEDSAALRQILARMREKRRQAAQLTSTVPKSLRDCRVWADMSAGEALSEVKRSQKQRQDMFARLEDMLRPALASAQMEARAVPR